MGKRNRSWNGGVVSTSELVFQGSGSGDIVAYDALNGQPLWTFPLQTGIVAPPITYMVDGVQYLTIVAGWGGGNATWNKFLEQLNPGGIYTFKIGGKEPAPYFEKRELREIVNLEFKATEEQINHGNQIFERYCGKCHGGDGVIPNLTYSRPEIFDAFLHIVGKGTFIEKGMPDFGDRLSDQDILNVKYYILNEAKNKRTFTNDKIE